MIPLRPETIDQHDDVLHSFQATLEFESLHESAPEAGKNLEIAEDCVNTAASILARSGVGGLDRLTISSEKERLMIFSMYSDNEVSPGARLFGIATKPEAQVDDIAFLTRGVL